MRNPPYKWVNNFKIIPNMYFVTKVSCFKLFNSNDYTEILHGFNNIYVGTCTRALVVVDQRQQIHLSLFTLKCFPNNGKWYVCT